MNFFFSPSVLDVRRILNQHQLPSTDLSEQGCKNFIACREHGVTQGIVGIEIYGDIGLLRSLAVAPELRGKGYGKVLLAKLEEHAQANGVRELYLLTESAQLFFKKHGFDCIDRKKAPGAIATTSQFSDLCPENATLMKKKIELVS